MFNNNSLLFAGSQTQNVMLIRTILLIEWESKSFRCAGQWSVSLQKLCNPANIGGVRGLTVKKGSLHSHTDPRSKSLQYHKQYISIFWTSHAGFTKLHYFNMQFSQISYWAIPWWGVTPVTGTFSDLIPRLCTYDLSVLWRRAPEGPGLKKTFYVGGIALLRTGNKSSQISY